jgi:hypothetical protein
VSLGLFNDAISAVEVVLYSVERNGNIIAVIKQVGSDSSLFQDTFLALAWRA